MVLVDITESPVLILGQGEHVTGSPTGIPSGAAVGAPQLNAYVNPAGVASTVTVGSLTGQAETVATASGVASTVTFGTPMVGTVNYAGTIAGSTTVGEPNMTLLLQPTGIGGGVTTGSPQLNATMNPDTASNVTTFGTTFVRGKALIFRGPTNLYKYRLWGEYEGISLLKEDGVWTEVAHPSDEQIAAADEYLGGGRDHRVSTALAAELVGEGYSIVEEYV